MSFGGVPFLILFLPLALILHWLLPRRAPVQNAAILLISYCFYASWHPRLLGVLVLTTLANTAAMAAMDRHRDHPHLRRRALLAGLAFNIGQLLYFKYLGFFATSLNALLQTCGLNSQLPVLRVVLPLGISFWTIQQVGWLIEVYHGRPKFRPTALEFAVFSAFFPQVVAGPIPRGDELMPQLHQPRALRPGRIAQGANALLLGYTFKFLIADTLARAIVNPIFAHPAHYSAIGAALGLMGYALQVFGDFAGYSLIAIGLGRLFGIELPQNFRYPFFSANMMEFWRRWHITLNRFLFDHLYWPLVSRRGRFRQRLDLGFFLVFALSGLWHGATWSFVAWGALHGLALAAHRRYDVFYRGLCRKDRVWVRRRKTRTYHLAAVALTQLFFILSLLPFRAPDLAAAWAYAGRFTHANGLHHPLGGQPVLALGVALSIALLVGYHALELKPLQPLRARFFAAPPAIRGLCYGLLLLLLVLFVPVGGGTFIYAQF